MTTYGSRELDRTEQVDNQPQFVAVMTSYGQSFLLPDIAIFKQNLEALQSLHSKWKLYHKVKRHFFPLDLISSSVFLSRIKQAIFREGIANQFISTLLNVLTNGSHELLKEEIGLAIYAMASPDFEAFFQHLLPNYLLNCQGIEDYQRVALKNCFTNDTVMANFDLSPLL